MMESIVNIINDNPEPYQNKIILQGFEWYSPGIVTEVQNDPKTGSLKTVTVSHWQYLTDLLPQLSVLGITSIWIPPACKATNPTDTGYGIYDLYDLGEFDTKGSIGTKWGTKKELQILCVKAKSQGIGIIFDAVLNHRGAADGSEPVEAICVDARNRTRELGKPRTIEAWTKFNYDARRGKYSSLKYNKQHFSGVDWDNLAKEKAIFKFVGTRPDGTKKGWAKDVGNTENGNYDFLMYADVDYSNTEVQTDVVKWGQWLLDELSGVRGIRLDAIKHYSADFQKTFIASLKENADAQGGDLFFVGEYWLSNSKFLSKHIDETFGGKLHLLDVALLYNLHNISTGKLRDLSKVFAGSLSELQPHRAVTFVTNHDTQEHQSLAAPIEPWFIPHAYALILLRQAGHPCVFWGDIYGTRGPQPRLPACGGRLARLLKARSLYAYGDQVDHFKPKQSKWRLGTHSECIAWQRSWTSPTHGLNGLVVVLSIAWRWEKRRVNVGAACAGQIWTDIMGWAWSGVQIDEQGYGDFPVGPRSISVWTWRELPGRNEIDGLVYPSEPEIPAVAA